MANRQFHRFQSLEREVKKLHLEVSIGASGAPTIVKGLGVESIERNGAGDYSITLEDKYSDFLHMHIIQEATTAEDLTFQLHSESVSSSKIVRFLCKDTATDTDPSNGSKLHIAIELKNSSVSR